MSNREEAAAVKRKCSMPGTDPGKVQRQQSVSLRPHHGLCLCFFEGYGYSDDFSKNMASVLKGLQADTFVRIVEGHDSICIKCPNRAAECPNAAFYDRKVLELCRLHAGQKMCWSEFQRKIRACVLEAGKLAEVCGNCKWFYICGKKV